MELNGTDGGEYDHVRLGGADSRRLSCSGAKRLGAGAAADVRGEGDQTSSGRYGPQSQSCVKGFLTKSVD